MPGKPQGQNEGALPVRLFRRGVGDLSESTMPFEGVASFSIGSVTVDVERGVASSKVTEVRRLLAKVVDAFHSTVTPPMVVNPSHLLMTSKTQVYGFIGVFKSFQRVVLWRPELDLARNVWHCAHEWLEMGLLSLGQPLPRWAIEGLAQLAGYHVVKSVFPALVEEVRHAYGHGLAIDLDQLMAWELPPSQVSGDVDHGNRALDEVIAFLNHTHPSEGPLYGAVLEAMVAWSAPLSDPLRTILTALIAEPRVEFDRLMARLCGPFPRGVAR